jgi:hypothetical protein
LDSGQCFSFVDRISVLAQSSGNKARMGVPSAVEALYNWRSKYSGLEVNEARRVKAFNSVGSPLMVNPAFKQGTPRMFLCGNSDQAKAEVQKSSASSARSPEIAEA